MAISAHFRPCTVKACFLGIIDFTNSLLKDISDQGRKLAAGMNLAIGEQGEEVEGRATTITGAPAEKGFPSLMEQDVKEVILQTHDGVLF